MGLLCIPEPDGARHMRMAVDTPCTNMGIGAEMVDGTAATIGFMAYTATVAGIMTLIAMRMPSPVGVTLVAIELLVVGRSPVVAHSRAVVQRVALVMRPRHMHLPAVVQARTVMAAADRW